MDQTYLNESIARLNLIKHWISSVNCSFNNQSVPTLLRRGFYTIIKNVSFLSPHKLYSSILLSTSFSLAIFSRFNLDSVQGTSHRRKDAFFVFICLVFGLCFFFFLFFLNRKPKQKNRHWKAR